MNAFWPKQHPDRMQESHWKMSIFLTEFPKRGYGVNKLDGL
jgi:hypothetical protein